MALARTFSRVVPWLILSAACSGAARTGEAEAPVAAPRPETSSAGMEALPEPRTAAAPAVDDPAPPRSAEPTAPTTAESRPPPEILAAHNRHRARHCAPSLEWSEEIARAAQTWADTLATRGCALAHSGTRLGENIAAATAGSMMAKDVADLWYGENAAYDFRRPAYSVRSGHFTQVVWVGSRRLGCGTTACRGIDLWVCQYDPAGNMEGAFRENVLPTSCASR